VSGATPRERYYVLFASSFRHETAPNISHETVDKVRTLCGLRVSDAATFEPDANGLDPDCFRCRRSLARRTTLSKVRGAGTEEEAQLACELCVRGHPPGQLRRPCGATGCECWCNR
jgi:hypothetical protein